MEDARGVDDEAAEQGDEADEAFGGTVTRTKVPPHARVVSYGRGHRFAAPRCWADAGGGKMIAGRRSV
jgi:hypothetical protein